MSALSFLLLLVLCALTRSRPLLVLHRSIAPPLVSSLNSTITYTIHNVGSSAASSLLLKDPSFPSSRFVHHTASQSSPFPLSHASLSANASFSFSFSLTPKRAGLLFVSAPSVAYAPSHVSTLATSDELTVEDVLAFRKRTEKFAFEWTAYAGMWMLLVAGPYVVSRINQRALAKQS